ncbi:MAG: hypothetical protein ACPGTU_00560 [Myxococcota bacterium]
MIKCTECKNKLAYDPEFIQADCVACATLQEVENERQEGPVRCGPCQVKHLASPPYYDEECTDCELAQLQVDIHECEQCGFRWLCTLDDMAQEAKWTAMGCPVCLVQRNAETEKKTHMSAYKTMGFLGSALIGSIIAHLLR